jgi:DNA-binding winged helix-turn-helix (wHTH) protein
MTATSTPDLQPCGGRQIMFGPFRLYPDQRVLLRADTPVRLGGRALEILIALVEHAGKIVRKADLTARVWPDTFVEEGTLRVHIAKLRKALGDGQLGLRYVENVTGHGYRFVAPLECLSSTSASCDRKDTAGQALPPTNSDS